MWKFGKLETINENSFLNFILYKYFEFKKTYIRNIVLSKFLKYVKLFDI